MSGGGGDDDANALLSLLMKQGGAISTQMGCGCWGWTTR